MLHFTGIIQLLAQAKEFNLCVLWFIPLLKFKSTIVLPTNIQNTKKKTSLNSENQEKIDPCNRIMKPLVVENALK